MKTVKQTAETLGISKQKLYRYLKARQAEIDIQIDEISGAWQISPELEADLRQEFIKTGTESHHEAQHEAIHDTENTAGLIQILKAQLAVKDRQIAEQAEQIKALTQAVINGQVIQKELADQIALLQVPGDITESDDTHQEAHHESHHEAVNDADRNIDAGVEDDTARSIFSRLFSRRRN